MPTAVAPGPDLYIYPAPQWADTLVASSAVNRNSELWRVRTVDVSGGSDDLPWDGSRYYFEFTRPTFTYATTRAVHTWSVTLAESATWTGPDGPSAVGMREKDSAKTKVVGTNGVCAGANTFMASGEKFITQGVAVGDTLWINSRKEGVMNYRYSITGVLGQTTLTLDEDFGMGGLDPGCSGVAFRVIRANPSGECMIDELFGGGPGGYDCKTNSFWKIRGPVIGAGNITAHIPNLVPGPATFYGESGVIPNLWDGMSLGGSAQLEWTMSVIVYNTSMELWGLGGPFDWNNHDIAGVDLLTEQASMETFMCYYQ